MLEENYQCKINDAIAFDSKDQLSINLNKFNIIIMENKLWN